MELITSLRKIKEIYKNGGNLIKYIKDVSNTRLNTTESILISYDFQAGNYIQKALKNPEWEESCAKNICNTISKYGAFQSLMEVGVGEATTFLNVINKLSNDKEFYGFDISWSRIKYAKTYLKSKKHIKKTTLFVGDLFNMPLMDNSIDFIYTWHSLEPNGGREEDALKELYRVSNKYIFLFEPSSEFADNETKEYILKHGYVSDLVKTAKKLGYNVVDNRLINDKNPLSSNNTGLIVIKKETKNQKITNPFSCPVTNTPLELLRGSLYSKESMLLYPIIDEIPCLLPNNAIIATHFNDDFNTIL